jgi:hypothetical protein
MRTHLFADVRDYCVLVDVEELGTQRTRVGRFQPNGWRLARLEQLRRPVAWRFPVSPTAQPTIGRRLFLGRYTMPDALERAQHYRYLTKECWRLATVETSTEIRKHYLEMADAYSALADAEELGIPGHENDD